MKKAMNAYVLDTSALFAFIENEPGSDLVDTLLERAESSQIIMLVSFMTFMEVYYITLQERDKKEAEERLRLMKHLPILRIDSMANY